MCGIAGVIARSTDSDRNPWDFAPIVKTMLSRIYHRGREEGFVSGTENCWLGCCRLPIMDRYSGRQPVQNEDGSVRAVFNGEIYNHEDLRGKLIKKHKLASRCDSELVVHLYEDASNSADRIHSDIRGMYAIAIYDARTGECALFRDPFGKKPLYVLETDSLVAFASEMKAFGLPADLQDFGKNCEIRELNPGETLRIRGGQVQSTRPKPRWHMDNPEPLKNMEEAAVQLRRAVEQAVEIRMPQDWNVAVLCSGGIDSVIVAYLAKKFRSSKNTRLKAYVIGTPNCADVLAAKTVCKKLDIHLEQVTIDESLLTPIIAEVVYHTESFEPNIVRNSLISYLLFKRIREDDYRVALCGEGADELFFGYADFRDESNQEELMRDLLDDLHRTQLLRVDRTSMAFNLETRVPFLDREVVDLACRIDPELKQASTYGIWEGKSVLRQAFRDVLPWETITRTKATLSYGAGMGDVSMSGKNSMEAYARKALGTERNRLLQDYPGLDLSTYERALYLYFYEQFYQVPKDYRPPCVARREICGRGWKVSRS